VLTEQASEPVVGDADHHVYEGFPFPWVNGFRSAVMFGETATPTGEASALAHQRT
jgi:hypothetical protein